MLENNEKIIEDPASATNIYELMSDSMLTGSEL